MIIARLSHRLLFFGILVLSSLAFLKMHIRTKSIIIGYQLGQLKTTEGQLLKDRSNLQMQLARLTSKDHLSLMVTSFDNNKPIGSVVLNEGIPTRLPPGGL